MPTSGVNSALWAIALPLAAVICASTLILDANWMAVIVRKGPQAAPPPLFRSPINLAGRWRRTAMLMLFILCLAPMMMEGPMGVWRALPPLPMTMILAALVASVALIFVSQVKGWRFASNLAALTAVVLLVVPYALTGAVGQARYLIVDGILLVILLCLFLSATLHKAMLGYQPRSRGWAWVRLIVDIGSAAAVLIGAFWL